MATAEEVKSAIVTKKMEDVGGGLFRCFSLDGQKQGLCLSCGRNIFPEVFSFVEPYGTDGVEGWRVHTGEGEQGVTLTITKERLLAGVRDQTTRRLLEEAFSSQQ
jgi:hypothetical protein